jgi:hypothetical protein
LRLADSPTGWSRYVEHLEVLAARPTEEARREDRELCTGWAIGTAGWKRSIAREHSHLAALPDLDASELREIKEQRCHRELEHLLKAIGKSHHDLARDAADAPWKLAAAVQLRHQAVPYRWISETLNMGSPHVIRGHVFRLSDHRSAFSEYCRQVEFFAVVRIWMHCFLHHYYP